MTTKITRYNGRLFSEPSKGAREEARRNIVDYIEMFYNSNRHHSCLDYLSSKEFEETWLLKKSRLTKVSIFS